MKKETEYIEILYMGIIVYSIIMMMLSRTIHWMKNMVFFRDLIKVILISVTLSLSFGISDYVKNKTVNALTQGYMGICLALIIKLYIDFRVGENPSYIIYFTRLNWLINAYENMVICHAFFNVNEQYSATRWKITIVAHVIFASFVVFKMPFMMEGVQASLTFESHIALTVNSIIDIAFLIYLATLELRKRKVFYMNYLRSFILLRTGYYLMAWGNVMYYRRISTLMMGIMDISIYLGIAYYICGDVMGISWKQISMNLSSNHKKIEESKGEKEILKMTNKRIQSHVMEIMEIASHLSKKLEKSAYPYNIKYVDKIKNNCKRLMKLTHNLIDLNDMEEGKRQIQFEKVNMVKLIEDTVDLMNPYIEQKKMSIEVHKSEEQIYSRVNAEYIERMLVNLVSNAIKYSNPDGLIQIYINKKISTGKVYLCVRDDGVGIPREKLQSIFNRFERVDEGLVRRQEGSGLGLPIVKSIVQLHKGEIKLTSKEKEGTAIAVILPLYTYREKQGKEVKEQKEIHLQKLKKRIEMEFSDIN